MNKIEKKAYNYLSTRLGYDPNSITFQWNTSPDFICDDGEKFEVKQRNCRTVCFSKHQFNQLINTQNLTILIYDKKQKCDTPLAVVPFLELLSPKKDPECFGWKYHITPDYVERIGAKQVSSIEALSATFSNNGGINR